MKKELVAENLSARELRVNFWWMSICFAVNHGAVTTPLVVATTLLGTQVANVGNGILNIATLLSSLLVAAPVVGAIGTKSSLICAMSLYCINIAAFASAMFFKDDDTLAWLFFGVGSGCGGLAAGVMWTAQGGYFARTATLLAEASGQTREAATSGLAGNFAFSYLAGEVGSKLGFSTLQALQVDPCLIGVLYTAVSAMAMVFMVPVYSLDAPSKTVNPFAKVWAAASLWGDPVIWLLSPTNLTFGFCAAYMNGYVNGYWASAELGPEMVGFLSAITAATAAALARLYGPLASVVGKDFVIAIGAGCFLCIPLCQFLLHCCAGWRWWLIVLYLLQGSGRAVYESTNRAMFSDFFTGPDAEGAFANCMLQASLSFAVCFFLQTTLTGCSLAGIVFTLAAVTPLSYMAARALHRRRLQKGTSLDGLMSPLHSHREVGA